MGYKYLDEPRSLILPRSPFSRLKTTTQITNKEILINRDSSSHTKTQSAKPKATTMPSIIKQLLCIPAPPKTPAHQSKQAEKQQKATDKREERERVKSIKQK